MSLGESLPNQANVVIIGGGIIGCSIAYHLAERGCDEILLLEQGRLTGGTTWHAAGLIGQLRADINMTRLVQYGAELVAALEDETGLSTGWKACGSITVARTPDRMVQLRRTAALADAFGVDAELLTAAEVGGRWDLARTDDLVGGVWLPADGKANPADITMALAHGARRRGVRIVEGVTVENVVVDERTVAGVQVDGRMVACSVVVNAAGMWAREFGARHGVSIPLQAVEHMYVVTEQINGVTPDLPVLRDPDGSIYVKEEVGGLAVGGFEANARPWGVRGIPSGFEFRLLGENWDQFGTLMQNAIERIPSLGDVGIKTFINGPESFTPDNHFIVGAPPELDGYYVAAGFNSTGIASSFGVGRAIGEWILDGQPESDLHGVDVLRFMPLHASRTFLESRVTEIPGLHYAVAYPHREFETGRDVLRSPLHDVMAEHGARFGQRMLWERPNYFDVADAADHELTFGRPPWLEIVGREHRGTREHVALFDMTAFGKWSIEGPDAAHLLARVCANDVVQEPGLNTYTQILNDRAGIEADVTVMRLDDERYVMITGSAERVRVGAWLRRHVENGEEVRLTDVTEDIAVIGVMGPKADQLLASLDGNHFVRDDHVYGTIVQADIAGYAVTAVRTSYVGERGWELHCQMNDAAGLHDVLWHEGNRFSIIHAGAYAMDSLRLESGRRAWGRDIKPDITPIEAGLGFAIRSGGGFIGGESIERQRQEGVRQRLVMLSVDDEVYLLGNEPLYRNGVITGWTTSGAYGHSVNRSLAMALIRSDQPVDKAFIADGSYQVGVDKRLIDASVFTGSPLRVLSTETARRSSLFHL